MDDRGVMPYGHRVCLTTAADWLPIDWPADCDEEYWELRRGRTGVPAGQQDDTARP